MSPWLLVVIELIGIGAALIPVQRALTAKRKVNTTLVAIGAVVGIVALVVTVVLAQPTNAQAGIGAAVVADMLLFGALGSDRA